MITNYRPEWLLPICGKVFGKIIFNSLFIHLSNWNFSTRNQSEFRPGDSCVHQLISIIHHIYKIFDQKSVVTGDRSFLDLSSAFDKIWRDDLLHKLRLVGICEQYFDLLNSFLSERLKRVLDSGSSSLSLNANLSKKWQWTYKCKMLSNLFNPDSSKQAYEIPKILLAIVSSTLVTNH